MELKLGKKVQIKMGYYEALKLFDELCAILNFCEEQGFEGTPYAEELYGALEAVDEAKKAGLI
ncbi:hypothetical protein H1164_03455 [Thermoactinomyces daqus]|uniref:Uncharacterized protein n=1 Tax=Thermoactinomyces daqus TaxID=1329516 RepID=A0A7W1X8J7_9BACL|nr:hypothetical protein [Thermoactinomyces daqus]MBA4541959.1 hypothetical protein [Thermoactinomyces daqus]